MTFHPHSTITLHQSNPFNLYNIKNKNHCLSTKTPNLMDCLVLPSYIMKRSRRRRSGPRLGYRRLINESRLGPDDEAKSRVKVVVGKEKREFLVDPFVLEENPFRILIEKGSDKEEEDDNGEIWKRSGKKKSVIFVDVDAILFEHLLWLMYNDSSSLFKLNVDEILDFYSQDF